MAPTIADAVRLRGNRTSGFDYIRITLAASIILWHAIPLSYGPALELAYWRSPFGWAYHFVLPMFFALSGFLVAGSLNRCPTLVSFFGLRVLRIVPALSVEITLSALLLGPALTSYTAAAYFTDPRFHSYFLNIVGEIHYVLPGLFDRNPLPSVVNAQLWTIPYELQCYLAIGGLAVTAALRRRIILLVVVVASQALWVWQAIKMGEDGSAGGASGPILVVAFLAGILFHLYRDRIRLSRTTFLVMLAGSIALSALPHGAYYLPLPATYMTIYLGLLNPRPIRLVSSGDYSYGLYLYGYPLQQAVAAVGPETHHWWINAGVSLPAALLIATLSWRLVEKPTLGLRHRIPAIEAKLIAWAVRAGRRTGIPDGRAGRPALLATFAAMAGVGGVGGSLLLANGTVWLACIAILGSFAVAFLASGLCQAPGVAAAATPKSLAAQE